MELVHFALLHSVVQSGGAPVRYTPPTPGKAHQPGFFGLYNNNNNNNNNKLTNFLNGTTLGGDVFHSQVK